VIARAAAALRHARRGCAFTGAGVSVESGIPTFRGPGGLWNHYDPADLAIDTFVRRPDRSWRLIAELYRRYFDPARPNAAHRALATLEQHGMLREIITQNIDNLHQDAGSRVVHEFHGSARELVCTDESCARRHAYADVDLAALPPRCSHCSAVLKPAFVMFGEPIPEPAASNAFAAAARADLMLLVGSSGEVMPACALPQIAKDAGATVVEVNTERTHYTRSGITDIFLEGAATAVLPRLVRQLELG